jgi:phosphopantetheinyl transferase
VDVDVPGDRKFWKQVWAGRILGPNERDAFAALRVPDARQLEWLGGRTAAKEAVRALLAAGPGIEATLADIEIQPDAAGRPVVSGPWRDRVPGPLGVSIAHSDGVAVAVVGASDFLGIDVERVRTPGRGFGEVAFDDEERQRLSELPEEWALRCWCAKEAVAKATGSGLSDGPGSVVITAVDPLEERLTARLAGRLAEAHPDLAGVDLVVQTRQVDDVVVAVAQDQRPPDEHAAATRPEWSTQR